MLPSRNPLLLCLQIPTTLYFHILTKMSQRIGSYTKKFTYLSMNWSQSDLKRALLFDLELYFKVWNCKEKFTALLLVCQMPKAEIKTGMTYLANVRHIGGNLRHIQPKCNAHKRNFFILYDGIILVWTHGFFVAWSFTCFPLPLWVSLVPYLIEGTV